MATKASSKRMYSWWWDSHISPKNSKWLQENLTDMDSKVKQMIKLIEEDADSFARRAEMYYKKRPELMKLVEEFYRAYRALAERYDHATGVIRQAHHTMAEAFPNQIPFGLSDESPGSAIDADPHTPEMTHPGRALFDPDELQRDALGLSSSQFQAGKRNGGFTDDSDSITGRKGMKHFNDMFGSGEKFSEGRARKGLNFHAVDEERDQNVHHNGSQDLQAQALSGSDRMGKAEVEISNLKKALAKLESEKEAGLRQYEQSLERLSNLESEVSRAQENSTNLNERANKAEAEVQNLKEALAKLQEERDANLVQYQQYLEKISSLENSVRSAQKDAGDLNERAQKAELEANSLKQDLAGIGSEKEAALVQYKQSLEKISNLEGKLLQAEEDAIIINERADKAEHEVESLKQLIAKLTEEKEATVSQYMLCLETISTLELKITRIQEEAERLNSQIDDGVAKLRGAEERCLALEGSNQKLQSELESLVQKVGSQDEELTEKQKELGRLWTCIHEERMRFVEAETAFQTLQHLHSQSQEELRSLVAELQNRADILNDMKTRNQCLEDEVRKVIEENKGLNELNLASAVSIKNLQDDILSMRETIKKLEEEVELRVDQRNALQQEIYCLKEQLNELSKKQRAMIEQVEAVGYEPECFGSSVKELQDENTNLKHNCETHQIEKLALLEQLKVMEKLMEKNTLLENSLADLNDELEGVKEKVRALEESCQLLIEERTNLAAEKTSLISQLRGTNDSLEKLTEKTSLLENTLFDANAEIEGLRIKSKSLEESCLLLDGEKSGLVTEREGLVSQLETTQQTLENLGNRYAALEEKLSFLEQERQKALVMVEELRLHLDAEKKQHANFAQLSEARLASRDVQIHDLQEEVLCRYKEYDEEQDNALNAHIQILILLKCIEGLEEKNLSLLSEHQKLLNASEKSRKLISELEHENNGQKLENTSLSEHNKVLIMGLYQLMKTLNIDQTNGCVNKIEQDQRLLNNVLVKLQETRDSLFTCFDENQRLITEKSVLVAILEQLQSEGANLVTERNRIDLEFRIQSEQLSVLHAEKQKLSEDNEELKLKIVEGDHREEALMSMTEELQRQLLDLQGALVKLQKDNLNTLQEKKSLTLTVSDLEEQNNCLEEDNDVMFRETIYHSNLSLVFNDIISKNLVDLEELSKKVNQVQANNNDLDEKAKMLEEELEGLRTENLHLKKVLDKSDSELTHSKSVNDQLRCQIIDTNALLSQKESEIHQWEGQVDLLFAQLQMSNVCEALLEGKINEIAEAYASLENESDSKGMEIGLLKQKLSAMEGENGELQNQFTAYGSALISLKNGITSLERHTVLGQPFAVDNVEKKDMDTELTTHDGEISQTDRDDCSKTVLDGLSNLADLENRVKAIEISVMEKEKIMMLENLSASTRLDAAMKEIDELKARSSVYRENGQTSKHVAAIEGQEDLRDGLSKNLRVRTRRKTQEICELGNEVLTKDIVLDQISSDYSSYGRSKREALDADNHLLELWETVDHDGSIDLKVGKAHKKISAEAPRAHKSKNTSVESLIEKELRVDKLELSRRFSEPRQEGNKKRVLERLDSDAQKLSNLQITIQDLKRKVEITEKSKKGKGIENDPVKGQLDEAEDTVTKLFDVNRKLVKSFEDGSQTSDGLPTGVLDENGSVRRRRVSEQARRGSEKIGRLQLEVQRLQFLLMKLDGEEKESRSRTRIPDHKSRVLLRDYLYGGTVRTARKHKRAPFCSCVQPPTRGD